MLDIAATFFVHGNVFDNVAVATKSLESHDIDGRKVTLITTSGKLGRPVTAPEFCGERPELYYVAQSLNKGLMLALTFANTMRKLLEHGGEKMVLTYTGERIKEFGVIEHAMPHKDDYEGFIFIDEASGKPYGSTVASAVDHGLVYLRTKPSNRIHLIDFAAHQYGANSLINDEAPLFVCTAGSERAIKIYGPDRIAPKPTTESETGETAAAAAKPAEDEKDWHRVRERELDVAIAHFLLANDSPENSRTVLRKQIDLATSELVSYSMAIFDMKPPVAKASSSGKKRKH